jgi:hypothetical protein
MGTILARRLAIAVTPALALFGCDDANDRPPVAPATQELLPWTGVQQQLFDDSIAPVSLGFSLDGHSPAKDPLLAPRAKAADLVARMRVQTMSRKRSGDRTVYMLTLQVGNPPLARPRLEAATLDLTVSEGSSMFALVSSNENSLRNRIFIGFVRRFPSPHGPVFRWHLTADTAEVAQAVQLATALESFSD